MSSLTDKQIKLLYKQEVLEEKIALDEILAKHADKNHDYETLATVERRLSQRKMELNIVKKQLAKIQRTLESKEIC